MTLRPWTAAASLLVGLANLAGGVAHVVGVTVVAARRGGLFDTRHTVLLTIGWTLIAPALLLLGASWAIWRGRAWGHPTALAASLFLLVEFVLLGAALGTPEQYLPAWGAAIAYVALVVVASHRTRSAAS